MLLADPKRMPTVFSICSLLPEPREYWSAISKSLLREASDARATPVSSAKARSRISEWAESLIAE